MSNTNCKTTQLYGISNIVHSIILGLGLIGELLVVLSLYQSDKQIVVKPLLYTIYIGGGLYLVGHCTMSWASQAISGEEEVNLWLVGKATVEETTGTIVLWTVTCLAVVRILAIRYNYTVREGYLIRCVKFIVIIIPIVYIVKEVIMIHIEAKCDCKGVVTRIMLYLFRLLPAVMMILTNLYLGYCLYRHVRKGRNFIPKLQQQRNNRVTKLALGTAVTMVVFCFPLTVIYLCILKGTLPEPCVHTLRSGASSDLLYEVACVVYDINYVADVIVYGIASVRLREKIRKVRTFFSKRDGDMEVEIVIE